MKLITRILSFILAALLILSLFGCRREELPDAELEITDDLPSRPENSEKAEDVFYKLIEYYYASTTVQNLPDNAKAEIKTVSARLAEITDSYGISAESYASFLNKLSSSGNDVIDEILADESQGAKSFDKTKSLYLDACALLGSECISSLAFDYALYLYDYRYNLTMSNYEKYGYSYLLLDAQNLLSEKSILENDVGKEDFISFVAGTIATSELILGRSAEGLENFSDEEILMFVGNIDLSFDISEEGYEFLFTRLSPLVTEGILSEIMPLMKENGDVEKLASIAGEIFSLIRFAQANLSVSDVAEIRLGNTKALIESAMSRFGDEEWEMLSTIGEIDIKSEEYEGVFLEKYEDFAAYLEDFEPVSIEELRASVGTDKFYESLKGYVGGISPVLSYGIK